MPDSWDVSDVFRRRIGLAFKLYCRNVGGRPFFNAGGRGVTSDVTVTVGVSVWLRLRFSHRQTSSIPVRPSRGQSWAIPVCS